MEQNDAYFKKVNAAKEAVKYIESGMTIGLGSGSTMNVLLEIISEKINLGLKIQGIPTSKKTELLAKELGIPLLDFSSDVVIDLAIDGTDEVDSQYNLLKGGGGSLVREKLVANASRRLIIIADETKAVSTLGEFSLPVEILQFGWEVTANYISKLGCDLNLRMKDDKVFISDNGNYIVDCQFDEILKPKYLHEKLKLMVGVVETGLFINMTDTVIIGCLEQTKYL